MKILKWWMLYRLDEREKVYYPQEESPQLAITIQFNTEFFSGIVTGRILIVRMCMTQTP